MTVYEYVIGAVLLLFSVLIIVIVLMQQGREANLGAISGGADSFMEKGKARTLDALLEKYTKVIAVVYFVLVLGAMLITRYLGA
ncbi:MAG: preprotein translocase subunit SecG [Clostridia bacterium]|nr:preprotein translocase subunit SecG [Clostridia bacterium]